jgi:hypothetical protein
MRYSASRSVLTFLLDFWLSAFFSLHHPLSLSNPIPQPASEETFNNIFESKPQLDVWENGNSAEKRPEDVIIALQDTIESLEGNNGASQDEAGVRWEVLQESSSNSNGVKHLDGPPKPRTIDDLVTQFKPFQPPPPPQAFPPESKASEKKRARATKPKSKQFQTTIVVTESTAADGHKTYTASQSPLVQIANAKESTPVRTASRQPHQPFLARAWRKNQAYLLSQRKAISARFLLSIFPAPRGCFIDSKFFHVFQASYLILKFSAKSFRPVSSVQNSLQFPIVAFHNV